MVRETLMHIDEPLTAQQREQLQVALGEETHFHSTKPHLMFVHFDPDQHTPHEMVALAARQGVHAQLIDF